MAGDLRSEEPCGSARAAVPRSGATVPARVLVVDDQDGVRRNVRNVLVVLAGCEVVEAASGEDALERLATQPFDLVVTDLSMPGMSGLDLAAAVRRTGAGPPVLLLTGQGEIEDDLAGDVDETLVKPVEVTRLVETVARMLKP